MLVTGLPGLALLAAAIGAGARDPGVTPRDLPSRAPAPRCAWEKTSDATAGLAAWVQRCDYGFRRIDFLFVGKSLAIRHSDGGAPEPLIDVIDLAPGATPQQGLRRHFDAHTEPAVAKRCVLAPYRGYHAPKPPAGVRRYTFVPDQRYRRELKVRADPNEVGDPPCGDWGDAPDGIRYFEVHAGRPERVLFVRVGQDEPLFDDQTLRLLSPAAK
jgi:hypothetical protein